MYKNRPNCCFFILHSQCMMQYDALHPNLWECANEDGSLVLKSCQSCKESLTVQLYHSERFASVVCDCGLWLPGDCEAEYPSIPFNIAEPMIAGRLIMMTGGRRSHSTAQPTFKTFEIPGTWSFVMMVQFTHFLCLQNFPAISSSPLSGECHEILCSQSLWRIEKF